MRKTARFLLLFFVVLSFLSCLCSCQSADKNEAYFSYNFEEATFEYDKATKKTKVDFWGKVTNNTIYNMKGFSIYLDLYYNETIVTNGLQYGWNMDVKSGENEENHLSFFFDGKINYIEFVSWSANYNTLWETYQIWFIVAIILVTVAIVAYIIIIIIQDLEFDDVFEFIKEHGEGFFFTVLPFVGGFVTFGSIIFSYWVQSLIVLGAILSFLLLALIAHFVKYLFDWVL